MALKANSRNKEEAPATAGASLPDDPEVKKPVDEKPLDSNNTAEKQEESDLNPDEPLENDKGDGFSTDDDSDDDSEDAVKRVIPNQVFSYFFPNAPKGPALIMVPYPVMKKGMLTDEIEYRKTKLDGGFFTVAKKEMKNSAYWKQFRKLMKESGFEEFSDVKNRAELKKYRDALSRGPKKSGQNKQTVFGVIHPENFGKGNLLRISFQDGEDVRVFEMVDGQLFTKDNRLHQLFIRNGLIDMGFIDKRKASKEIIKKKPEDEDY